MKIQRSFDDVDKLQAGKLGLWELEQVLHDLGYAMASYKNDAFAELYFGGDGTVQGQILYICVGGIRLKACLLAAPLCICRSRTRKYRKQRD